METGSKNNYRILRANVVVYYISQKKKKIHSLISVLTADHSRGFA